MQGTLSCTEANIIHGFAATGTGTTGGAGGTEITVTTGLELQSALSGKGSQPLTIYVNGTISPANSSVTKFDIKNMSDVSIIGVGTNALFDGIGIKINSATNVILRNLTIRNVDIGDKDAIGIEGPASHIWIDHNELHASLEVDKDYYDGLLDSKRGAENITVSFNYMHDSWKSSLHGSSDTDSGNRYITFHHNRWENLNSRTPLFRFGEGHIFNNYYKDILSTGINSRMGAKLRIEGNVFETSKNPIVSIDSSELGYWDLADNELIDVNWSISGDASADDGGSTTSYVPPYSYSAMAASETKAHVLANAGVGKINSCLGEAAAIGDSSSSSSTSTSSTSSSSDSSSSTSSSTTSSDWTGRAVITGGSSTEVSGSMAAPTATAVTLDISGGKLEGSAESLYFASQTVTGDFIFTANIAALANPLRLDSDQGMVGIMLCSDCSDSTLDMTARVGINNKNGQVIAYTHRLADLSLSKVSTAVTATAGGDLFVRIVRSGNSYTSYYSLDGGVNYTQAGSGDFGDTLPAQLQIGVFAVQGVSGESNSVSFDDISLSQ